MSQLILDDQLNAKFLLPALQKWTTVDRLQSLRPGEHILDDRVPVILLTVRMPTFVTIDEDHWDKQLCNPGYCILFFALQDREQKDIPKLLRQLLRKPEFASRSDRMGKVVRISRTNIAFWQFQEESLRFISWKQDRKKRK